MANDYSKLLAVPRGFTADVVGAIESSLLDGKSDRQIARDLGMAPITVCYFRKDILRAVEPSLQITATETHNLAVKRLERCLQSAQGVYTSLVEGVETSTVETFEMIELEMKQVGVKVSKQGIAQASKWMAIILQIQKELRDLQGVTPPEVKVVQHIDVSTPRESLLEKLALLKVVEGERVD